MELLYVYLIIINAVGFIIMLVDKLKAKAGAWRIPEATLLTIAAIGGSLGSYLGMQTFRHKTKHPKFTITVPLLLIAHILLLLWLHGIL